ncbi:MAG: adenosylhomocysteinase [Herbiconiux sp.]|nr:adenosylhomocysteinase [Herbiconiux sp.]
MSTSTPLDRFRHPDVRWAAQSMPLLTTAFDELGDVFAGLRIGMCLHIEPKTAVLCTLLARAGATVALTGSPGTTRQDIAEALSAAGVLVHASAGDSAPRVDAVLDTDPHILLDNGADLTQGLLDRGDPPAHFLGGTEETTTGALLLRQRETDVPFPVIVINDSALKLLVENRFGVGQSVVQGFMNATNRMIPGSRATVVGYGPCGRGVAQTLRELGAQVTVVEIDPYRRIEAALEGHRIADTRDALPGTQLLFLATGHPDVLDDGDLAVLDDGVVIAGVGHRPWELDLARLGTPLRQTGGTQTAHHDVYAQADGRRIVVLAATRMINLVAGGGNPIEAMDLGLTLQARSLAAIASGDFADPGVHPVPAGIDRRIATAFADRLAGR